MFLFSWAGSSEFLGLGENKAIVDTVVLRKAFAKNKLWAEISHPQKKKREREKKESKTLQYISKTSIFLKGGGGLVHGI